MLCRALTFFCPFPTNYLSLILLFYIFQRLEINGVRYSHIVNPHTGLGLTDHALVTILAPDCMTADSLATAASALGPERGLQLIEETPEAAAHLVRKPGDKIEFVESSRWKKE